MIYISPAAEKITGYSVNELMAEPNLGSSITHPEDQKLWNEHVCKANEAISSDVVEYRIIRKDGLIRWISHTCRTIFDNTGKPIGVRGCNTDITASKLAESALKESEERFRLIASAAHDAIVMADKKGLITFWNNAAARLFGMPADRAIGLSLNLFLTTVANELQTSFIDLLFSPAMISQGGASVEVQGVNHQTGANPVFEVSVSTARLTGKTFAIMLIRDITDRKEAEEQLQYLSMHDPLTGLQNRAAFEQELLRLKQSELFPVSIIMADLDGLKSVNDSKGHDAGDRLIKAAAKLLYSSFRIVDTVARVGGDEFLILLPGMDEHMAKAKLEHIRNLLEFSAADQKMPEISMSLGTATAHNAESIQSALKEADNRMYQEKFSRRNSNS
jgi:diguanylate cyclase (GGDEF)-like protein/PAS domain S-box-containing protein